ncbi:hypothetical protein BO82DRAFT_356941 [Aspergillus uvarum CBS 121591]|uniref:Uncharacterized protein n=1 Tax=Aspergillus uvarum CBS 121591 TaxID=1448315 RepID=A0A319BZ09_9EURO|nr:hypothetical protein BO82DRAFT_356941 [Aspergillus uvarum CBS 121591]PYH78946.1 hypothetical protein BO82DRAFT_356941 [Aspergillus uvarum CBS 121591]
MFIYSGKFSYAAPYATNELFSVVFRDNVLTGDRVAVILQWSKDAGGQVKSNSNTTARSARCLPMGPGERRSSSSRRRRTEPTIGIREECRARP